MNSVRVALMVSVLALGAPAFAQDTAAPAASAAAPALAAGTAVVDPDGGAVGTITSVDGEFAVVKTDKHEVRLAKTAFAARPEGVSIGLSRDALNASVEQSLGSLDEKLQAGTTVAGAGGNPLGTVASVEGDLVTLKLASGKMVRLPKTGFAPTPTGLMIGMSGADLEAQAGGS